MLRRLELIFYLCVVLAVGCTPIDIKPQITPTGLPAPPTALPTPTRIATPFARLFCNAFEVPDGSAVCFPVLVRGSTAEFNEDGSATGVVFDDSNVLMIQMPTESGRCYLRGARRWVACGDLMAGDIVGGDFVAVPTLENSN